MLPETKTARFSSSQKGLAKFNFTVTDAAGSTMTRSINVLVGDNQTAVGNVNVESVSIYPSPATNEICISGLAYKNDFSTIYITNVSGQKVLSKMLNTTDNKIYFDVSSLTSGVYFVSAGKISKVARFIKL